MEGRRQKAAQPSAKPDTAAPAIRYGTHELPGPVIDMREAILGAVRAGRIEELTIAIQMNELKPDFAAHADPIQHLKSISGDGEGREVLAALSLILDAGYVALPLGIDIENNRLYVWPYHAEVPIAKLSPAQEVELMRLARPAEVAAMKARKRYAGWRIAIGADGTWHSFGKVD